MSGLPLIRVRGLTREYEMGAETVHALRGVDLDIGRNAYVAIMGPSGSGKSTLMNLIGCLDTPTAGEYWLNGIEVSRMNDDELARVRNREIGFVFQTFNLPTGNLDSVTSAEIMDVFADLYAQGQTVLMVTHEAEIAAHARRVITLRDGTVFNDDVRDAA